MYDDETEVFNLANRCLETSISDPKDLGTSCRSVGSKGRGGKGDDSWKRKKSSILSFTCWKWSIDRIRTNRLVRFTIHGVKKIGSFSRNSFEKFFTKLLSRSISSNEERKEKFQERIVSWNNSSDKRCKRLYTTDATKNKKGPSIARTDTRSGVKCRGCKPPLSISKLRLHLAPNFLPF